LVINCDNCESRYINSCSLIQSKIRKIIFAMRLLDIGYEDIRKFYDIMELSKTIYQDVNTNIYCMSKTVASVSFSDAATEEKNLMAKVEPMGSMVFEDVESAILRHCRKSYR